jgi:iron transport multicopper oxidase
LAWEIKPESKYLYTPIGAGPIPDSFLFDNSISQICPIQAGKANLIRLLETSAIWRADFWIEDHAMPIVDIDGVRKYRGLLEPERTEQSSWLHSCGLHHP